MTDYLAWLQALPPSRLASLAAALAKAQVGLELEELEEAARLTLLEEEESEGIVFCRQNGKKNTFSTCYALDVFYMYLLLQGVSRHWTPGNLAKSQPFIKYHTLTFFLQFYH